MILDLWAKWVAFTARPTDSRPLRWVQILVAVCVIGDLVAMMVRGAYPAILFPRHLGGISEATSPMFAGTWGANNGPILWVLMVASLACVALGIAKRPAQLVALISYAQFGHMYTPGDRGIDRILRTVMLILLFSAVNKKDVPAQVAAWPSDLIRWFLMIIYMAAGVAKLGTASGWLVPQEYPELYQIMAAPNIGRFDPVWMADFPWVFTAGGWFTFALEGSAFLLLTRFAPYWAVLGVVMHFGIGVSMELGMFPFGMLALYPVLFAPWIARWAPTDTPPQDGPLPGDSTPFRPE